MATPTVNILSYNSTGMNTIKTDWIRNFCKLVKIDFCTIQEHFKKSKSDKFFKEHFNDFFNVIPAFRAENQDSGQPKGGLAQLIRKNV